jgi:hypothetical protein
VWGPTPDSLGDNKYYVSFINDFNKFTWIYVLKFKSEVFQKYHEIQWRGSLTGRSSLCKLTLGGYEKLNSFLQSIGITHHVSCPHDHQHNGSVERNNQPPVGSKGPGRVQQITMMCTHCHIYSSHPLLV